MTISELQVANIITQLHMAIKFWCKTVSQDIRSGINQAREKVHKGKLCGSSRAHVSTGTYT